jgi:hypothetical protein
MEQVHFEALDHMARPPTRPIAFYEMPVRVGKSMLEDARAH